MNPYSTPANGRGNPPLSLCLYLKDLASSHPLTREEEKKLFKRIKKGDPNARKKLVEANLRFVISIAREYHSSDLPLEDLISAGNKGIMEAVDRFDERRGYKFISYAVWWIRQSILMALKNDSRTIRFPINVIDAKRKIYRASRKRAQETESSDPDLNYLSHELKMPPSGIENILNSTREIWSLDKALNEENGASLLSILPDKTQPPPDQQIQESALSLEIEKALGTLSEKEREIIKHYFGLDGYPKKNLEEIGRLPFIGLTRERVRQIKKDVLRKLSYPSRSKLKAYAEDY